MIVAGRKRQRQRVGEIENVRRINPDIIVAGIGAHRRDGAVGLVDDDARMHEAAARAQRAQFGERGEAGAPAIIGEPGDEPVAAPERPAFVNRLQRAAEAGGFGRRGVQLRVRPAVQEIREPAHRCGR